MINVNGKLLERGNENIGIENRGFKFADGVFETLKIYNGSILFWEDHYFRLMSSMRIMRMEIPMNFTMEFLEAEILRTLISEDASAKSARVRLTVNRAGGGLYMPETNDVDYVISTASLANSLYECSSDNYVVDLFKDHYITPGLLSNIKKSDKSLNVLGSIYAQENDLNNCLLINSNKNLVEALNGNIFLVFGTTIKTPALEDGCVKGVLRKQIIDLLKRDPNYSLEETTISPFEMQRADEVFITNVIAGIRPITKYRKKEYHTDTASYLVTQLNEAIEN